MDSVRRWRRSASTAILAVVAVLRAEKVVGICCEIQSTLRTSVDGRHCTQNPSKLVLGGRSLAIRACANLGVLVTAKPQAYQPQDRLGLLTETKLHHDYTVGSSL